MCVTCMRCVLLCAEVYGNQSCILQTCSLVKVNVGHPLPRKHKAISLNTKPEGKIWDTSLAVIGSALGVIGGR